jgi:hypothetical protein
MHALKTLVAATAASLSLSACATGGASGPDAMRLSHGPMGNGTELVSAGNTPAASEMRSPATVRVANYNWMDVNVYAVQGGTRIRLGTVTTMNTSTFRLPERFLTGTTGVRLMVDPIGSTEGYVTDGILVHGGQQISFNVQNSLQFSSISVGGR